MSRTRQDEGVTGTSPTGGPLARAWIAVALIPLSFILAFVVAEVLYSLMGYQPSGNTIPLWVDLVASTVAVVVFLVPCTAAVLYGRRAQIDGDRRGLIPLVIGACAGVGILVLTVATVISTPHG